MDVSKTVSVLALQRTIALQQQLTKHESQINELTSVQSAQSEQIERLSLVVGQLRGLVRHLWESNQQLRRQIGGVLFLLRLAVSRRRNNTDYRFVSTIAAVVSARILSRLLFVDTMAYILTIPLASSSRTARRMVTVASTMALVVYLQPRIEHILSSITTNRLPFYSFNNKTDA